MRSYYVSFSPRCYSHTKIKLLPPPLYCIRISRVRACVFLVCVHDTPPRVQHFSAFHSFMSPLGDNVPPQRHAYKVSGKRNGCVLACSTKLLVGTYSPVNSVPPDIFFTGECLPLTLRKPKACSSQIAQLSQYRHTLQFLYCKV